MFDLEKMGQQAVEAKYKIQMLSKEKKNLVLEQAAKALVEQSDKILAANAEDIEDGIKKGMHEGLIDRLRLNRERIEAMALGLRQIACLNDPVGDIIEAFDRPNGLHIEKVRVPLGVVGIIYESRPNVTADAFGLCFKASNVVILKGGSDAIRSNKAITEVIRGVLAELGLDENMIQLIPSTDRETATAFMRLNKYVNVLIPRGGAGLIQTIVNNSTIPVIETGTGNCHVYVDEDADIDMAIAIIVNSKTQRIGVCNACESLVVHEKIKDAFLPKLKEALDEYNVEIRGDAAAASCIACKKAEDKDYGREYLDYILSIKTVASVDEAIAHINKYNTKHSETIVTENMLHAEEFLRMVDAACVYLNASTRFTDGFEFGFGAEIGISTQMLHARGPMGLKELTAYKYQITGTGQIRD